MPVPEIGTARLRLPPLSLADAPQIQARFPRWEVGRFLPSRIPGPAQRMAPQASYATSPCGDGGGAGMALDHTAEGGAGGADRRDRPDAAGGRRSRLLARPGLRGKGVMTEAGDAVTDYGFGPLGQPVLRVPKAAANLPSRRVSERSGMRLIATAERDHVCGRLPAEIREITREGWWARRPPPPASAA